MVGREGKKMRTSYRSPELSGFRNLINVSIKNIASLNALSTALKRQITTILTDTGKQ